MEKRLDVINIEKEKQIWKAVIGYESYYMISNWGNVYSVKLKRYLIKSFDKNNYYRVSLRTKIKNHNYSVARLVAIHFVLNPDDKPQVNHLDGVKTNNYYKNLEWSTASENQKHSFKSGLNLIKGENSRVNKLTEKQVLEIRSKYVPRVYSQYKLAKEYNVARTTIEHILLNKNWKI